MFYHLINLHFLKTDENSITQYKMETDYKFYYLIKEERIL
jgi:hypothetical protein